MRPFDEIRASEPGAARQPVAPAISRRVATIAPSQITGLDARVERLAASGRSVIRLDTSELAVPTPLEIVEAAAAACHSQRLHRRTPAAGLPALREAIAAKTARDLGLDVSPWEVVVTSGGQQSMFNAMTAIVDQGDEVLLPAPYCSNYRVAVQLTGARVVSVPGAMGEGFKVSVDQLESGMSRRTKALILCSPCNPTGAVYSEEELRSIGEWAENEGLWVITDKTYEQLVYGGVVARSLPALVPSLRDRCIVVCDVAVALAMTGWPIGWLVGPPPLAEAVTTFQENTTSHPDNIAQTAALAALEIGLDLDAVKAALDRRRLLLLASLRELPGIEVVEPRGGLHVFPSVAGYLGGRLRDRVISTSLDLAAALLDHAGVAVAPGEAFGGVGHLRVSFGVSDHELDEGVSRLVGYLTEVRGAASATGPVSMSGQVDQDETGMASGC